MVLDGEVASCRLRRLCIRIRVNWFELTAMSRGQVERSDEI